MRKAGDITRHGNGYLARAYLDEWEDQYGIVHKIVRQRLCGSETEASDWIINSIEGYQIKMEQEAELHFC